VDPVCRPARRADLEQMVDVFLEHVASPRAEMLATYGHVLDTGHFHVAEDGGRLVAIAGATVRGPLWYLNAFWARKADAGRGLGMRLLRAVHEAGRAEGATIFCTWSSSNPAAMASYLKIGLMPAWTIFAFSGVPASRASAEPLDVRPLDAGGAERIERTVFGVYRAPEHAYHAGPGGLRARQVLHRGEPVGYFYAGGGSVGPAAWTAPEFAAPLLAAACAESAAPGEPVTLAVPGINRAGLRFALDAGLRLVYHNHFMASAPFGAHERYLPSGPSFY